MSDPVIAATGAPPGGASAAPDVGARAARGGGVLLLRHAVAFALNAAGGLVLARELGPETMGLYFAAATLFVVGRQLVDFSTTPFLVRAGADGPADGHAYWLQQIMAATLVCGTALAIGLGLTSAYAPGRGHELALLVGAAALGGAAWSQQAVPVARLERRLEYQRIGRIEVLEPLAFNTVAVALVLGGASAWGLAAALVLRGVVPALAAHRAARFRPGPLPGRGTLAALARAVLPLVGAQAVLWVILAAPAAIVGPLAGTRELGYAQLAASLLGSAAIPAAIVQRVAFAGLARLETDPERFARGVRRAIAILASLSLPMYGAIAGFAPAWVPRLCGPEWSPMARVLLVAALPATIAGLSGVVYAAILARGMNRLVLGQNLLHAAAYVGSMAPLARPLGALSAPVAQLIAMPSVAVYLRAFARQHAPLRLYSVIAALVGAAVLAVGCFALASAGRIGTAAVLWIAAHAVVLPPVWRRLELAALVRRAWKGEGVAVSGV